MRHRDLELIQINAFLPIVRDLQSKGCSTDRLLKRSGLTAYSFEDLLGYVPAKLVYNFFHRLKSELGIEDFLGEFAHHFQMLSTMQHGQLMAYSPDIMTACHVAVKFEKAVFTHERLSLQIDKDKAMMVSTFIDTPDSGRDLVILSNLALMLNTIRRVLGNSWQPEDLYLQLDYLPDLNSLIFDAASTRIIPKQNFTGFTFDTSLLTHPMLGEHKETISVQDVIVLDSLTSKVESLLESNRHDYIPSIKVFSELSGVSLRSFQRSLATEGTTFSEILDNWRFKKSLALLKEPGILVKEISQILCYSNESNFERAFRRWTNTHPTDYRSKL